MHAALESSTCQKALVSIVARECSKPWLPTHHSRGVLHIFQIISRTNTTLPARFRAFLDVSACICPHAREKAVFHRQIDALRSSGLMQAPMIPPRCFMRIPNPTTANPPASKQILGAHPVKSTPHPQMVSRRHTSFPPPLQFQ